MVSPTPLNARGRRTGRGRGKVSPPRTQSHTAGASNTVQQPDEESHTLEEQLQER